MNEQTSNTHAAFMEVTTRKVEGQDSKIAALEEKIKEIPDNTEWIQKLINAVEELRFETSNSYLPAEKIQDFSIRLDLAIGLLKHPVRNTVIHHHHIPKLILISTGLFIAFVLACSGWYLTGSKLDNYVANDTKYRQLRLDTGQTSLQLYLYRLDSLYNGWPDMRKTVLETEEEYRLNFERLQKAERLKAEAKELEKAAAKKK